MTDTEHVLWGSHPAYADGTVIAIAGGTPAQAKAAKRQRERDGGWTLAIYPRGTQPTGLRLQVAATIQR